MTETWLKVLAVALLGLLSAGCADGVFNADGAAGQLQDQPQKFDGEQVMLNPEHLSCGERNDLWVLFDQGGGRAVGRLTDRARKAGFSDDVHIGDEGLNFPYAQIRGTFSVVPSDPVLRPVDAKTQILEARVGVLIDHTCFQNPLPVLMGLLHGRFSAEVKPAFRFKLRGEHWTVDQLVH